MSIIVRRMLTIMKTTNILIHMEVLKGVTNWKIVRFNFGFFIRRLTAQGIVVSVKEMISARWRFEPKAPIAMSAF
jgi:hypothetical protein